MDVRRFASLIVLFLTLAWCCAAPLPEDEVLTNVDKRALEDPPLSFSPYSNSFGFFPPLSGPGIKPLRPILPPGFFLNRFATTPPPPVDPMASFFKARKEEFLNQLFDDITIGSDATGLQARSVVGATADDGGDVPVVPAAATTPKPKIDTSAFITKKFDFLTTLFKTLNTSTPAPDIDPADPTATTIKPTIVPPGFWLPVTLPPKPPKPTKTPKPAKTKPLPPSPIDEGLLKSILEEFDPANPALVTRQAVAPAKEESFLDKFLHRLTDAPPTESALPSSLESRSIVFPPDYWVPPYIYAAKMGIYLDKIFDTIDEAAAADQQEEEDSALAKRSDPSSMILEELTALKNEMMTAYLDGLKAATAAPATKTAPKKPIWGPKTTPAPNPAEQKATLLSDIFDKLAAVQQELLAGPSKTTEASAAAELATDDPATPSTTPAYWALDPTVADVGGFYKSKTQKFLLDLFASKFSTTPAPVSEE